MNILSTSLALLGVTALLGTCTEADAQDCMPAQVVTQMLAEKYQERPVSYGQIDASRVLVLFLAPDGETFTLVVMRTDGFGCPVAGGIGWEQRDVPRKPDREG